MHDKVFDRVEKKYLLTKRDKRELLKFIKKNMRKDSYHESEVCNIYFDNHNFDLISQSIDWVDFKEKVRARCYEGYDRVFMELKTKIHAQARMESDDGNEENIGYKRRVMITRGDFDELINHRTTLESLAEKSVETKSDCQIAREIDYLLMHFELRPQVFIAYRRESYKDDGGLRITFDENLRYRTTDLSLIQAKHDTIYFKDDHNIIMEVKADGVMPLWLVQELSKLKLYPQQFSKIGKVYQDIVMSKGKGCGGGFQRELGQGRITAGRTHRERKRKEKNV
ncbi:polyphosphate polymerase domain-containing protein [Candidatus Saccharibacteria bacterium]|nr:polyphosphate polymerase domain-containing protein [Candidatus Saccharibacteria bacterium]